MQLRRKELALRSIQRKKHKKEIDKKVLESEFHRHFTQCKTKLLLSKKVKPRPI